MINNPRFYMTGKEDKTELEQRHVTEAGKQILGESSRQSKP